MWSRLEETAADCCGHLVVTPAPSSPQGPVDDRRTSPMKPLRSGTRAAPLNDKLVVADGGQAAAAGAEDLRASAPAGSGMAAARSKQGTDGRRGDTTARSMPMLSTQRPPAAMPSRPAGAGVAAFRRKNLAATLHTDTVANAVMRPRMAQDSPRLTQTLQAGEARMGGSWAAARQAPGRASSAAASQGRPQDLSAVGVGAGGGGARAVPRSATAGGGPGLVKSMAAMNLGERRALGAANRSVSAPRAVGTVGGSRAGAGARSGSSHGPAGLGGAMAVTARSNTPLSVREPRTASRQGGDRPIAPAPAGQVVGPSSGYPSTSAAGSPPRGGVQRIVTSTGQPRKVPAQLVLAMQQQGAVAGVGTSPVASPTAASMRAAANAGVMQQLQQQPMASPGGAGSALSPRPPSVPRSGSNIRGAVKPAAAPPPGSRLEVPAVPMA